MNGSGARPLSALYVAAPFSMSYVDFYTFLMPLHALSLRFDAAEVGILVGARDVWSRLSVYGASLMLLAVPATALSLTIMAMRIAPTALRAEIPHRPGHPIQRLDSFRFRLT